MFEVRESLTLETGSNPNSNLLIKHRTFQKKNIAGRLPENSRRGRARRTSGLKQEKEIEIDKKFS